MSHTPGPWIAAPHNGHANSIRWVICGPNYDNRVAVISLNGAPHGDRNIELDNANLIAAAPELLEALEELANFYGSGDDEDNTLVVVKARAAIAKAKGEA